MLGFGFTNPFFLNCLTIFVSIIGWTPGFMKQRLLVQISLSPPIGDKPLIKNLDNLFRFVTPPSLCCWRPCSVYCRRTFLSSGHEPFFSASSCSIHDINRVTYILWIFSYNYFNFVSLGPCWREIIVYSRSTINACSLLSHEWWILLIKFMVGPTIHVRRGSTHLWFSGST